METLMENRSSWQNKIFHLCDEAIGSKTMQSLLEYAGKTLGYQSSIQNNSAQINDTPPFFLLRNQININHATSNHPTKKQTNQYSNLLNFAFPSSKSNQYWLLQHQIILPKKIIEPNFQISWIWIHIRIWLPIILQCYWNVDFSK